MIKDFLKITLYQPLFNLLTFFAWLVPGHSLGWAIIILTILVRLILWMPSLKALRAPLQLRQYQDEIRDIQERYKNDRSAQAQALMTFYRQKGINPLSGCLPLLIQLPVIFILYHVFMTGLQHARLDLLYSFTPRPPSLNPDFFGINLAQPDRFILPLIAALTQFLQSYHIFKLNPINPRSNDPTAILNKQMLYLFPVMTYFIALSLPAGLAVYWAASSLFSVAQQHYVIQTFRPSEVRTRVTVRKKK